MTITKSICDKIAMIEDEQNIIVKERAEVIHGIWVANVSQQHLVMVGPGGSAKSFAVRDTTSRIMGATHFEVALDETTDPGQVFGPPDIKGMVEEGKTRRVTTGMLSEATHAFVDEIFNANSPVLHSLMPVMNERLFHNNGVPSDVPLRALFAGTNKLNADADLSAFFDRLHLRYVVGYVTGRANQADMVAQAIARMSTTGRGTSTGLVGQTKTVISLEELDQAHTESLALNVDDPVMNTFLDLREELTSKGIIISDRRMVEGMAAVLANAYLRGHDDVQVGDLDILANMWWLVQDQITEARAVILALTNPGEKAALDLLDDLDKFRAELQTAQNNGVDPTHLRRIGVEQVRNTDKLLRDAAAHLESAKAAGTSTARLTELVEKAEEFKMKVGLDVFGIDPEDLKRMTQS